MDKTMLKKLVSNMSEEDIVRVYQNKSINNMGFRASNVNEVKKKRKVLEINLLNQRNSKPLDSYFRFIEDVTDFDVTELTWEDIIELDNEDNFIPILAALYVHHRYEDFDKYIEYQQSSKDKKEPTNSDATAQAKKESTVEDNEMDNPKHSKTIKKLEAKLKKITDELNNKEQQHNDKVTNLNAVISDLKTVKEQFKLENDKLNRKLKAFQEENVLMKKQKEISDKELKDYEKIVKSLNEKVENLEQRDITSLFFNRAESNIQSNAESLDKEYQIAVFGRQNDLFDTNKYAFEFFEGLGIKDFIENNFNELWIIQYDLTQREQFIINSNKLKSKTKINVELIHNLRELNEIITNLKKVRG